MPVAIQFGNIGGPRYMRDRDQNIRLAYNEFGYKKTKDTYNLGDRFLKNNQFSIPMSSQIKRPHIRRSACIPNCLKVFEVL